MFWSKCSLIFFSVAIGYSSPNYKSDPSAVVLTENDNAILLQFSSSQSQHTIVHEEGEEVVSVNIPGEVHTSDPGKPILPVISRNLIVPEGMRVEVTLVSQTTSRVELDHPILRTGSDNNTITTATKESANELYPAEQVVIGEPMRFRNYNLVNVSYHPYQYDLNNDQLIQHDISKVQIEFEPSTGIPDGANPYDQRSTTLTQGTYRFLNSLTMNAPRRDDDGASLPRGGYLILVGSSLDADNEAILELADWKRACGHYVEVVELNGTQSANPHRLSEEIIEPAYLQWDPPVEYICLVGSNNDLLAPATKADVLFGCIEGNDYVPEIAVTRIWANSNSRVEVAIKRAIGYQYEPYTDDMEWFGKGIAAGDQVSDYLNTVKYTLLWIGEALRRTGFDDVGVLLPRDGNVQSFVNDAAEEGAHAFFIRSDYYCSAWQDGIYPIHIQLSGHGENPMHAYWSTGSVNMLKGPSIAGCTWDDPDTEPNNILLGATAKGLLVDNLPIGWARGLAVAMLEYAGSGGNHGAGYHVERYEVFGEPGQHMWRGQPLEFEVSHKNTISPGTDRFSVLVFDPDNEVGIPDAMVTLTRPGQLMQWRISDSDGQCNFELDSEDDEPFFLTVSGDNFIPYRKEIVYEVENIFLSAQISSIDDEEYGNADGVLNPGETVAVELLVTNHGDRTTAEEVKCTITSLSPWVTIADDSLMFDDINPGSDQLSWEPFLLSLAESAPAEVDLGLNAVITTYNVNWESRLSSTVEGAKLEVNHIRNGNKFNGGTLELSLINNGSVKSKISRVRLVSSSWQLNVYQNLCRYPQLIPGEADFQMDDPFGLDIHDEAVPGSTIEMLLLLSVNDEDAPDTIRFDLIIDEENFDNYPYGPDEYGYYSFDNTDEEWEQAPTYDWIEINANDRYYDYEGSSLPGGRSDEFTKEIELPFDFTFYGESFNRATVSENGFIALGEDLEDLVTYANFPLDNNINGSFGMIAPFWDDLDFENESEILTHYIEEDEIFVIEWYEFECVSDASSSVTFQILLYNPEQYPTVQGDGIITFQYKEMTDFEERGYVPHYFSTGISSPDGSIGLSYVSDNKYKPGNAEIENRRAINFMTSFSFPPTMLSGTVLDASDDSPVEKAQIATSYGLYAITDEEGYWEIRNAQANTPFSVTITKFGFNDSTLIDLYIENDDSLELEISLLHPQFDIYPMEFSMMVDSGEVREVDLSIRNDGNGPLEWFVQKNLPDAADASPWTSRFVHHLSDTVEDYRIQGAVYANREFYISGRNYWDGGYQGRNMMYVVSDSGAFLREFEQPGDSRNGITDFTYAPDSDLLWAMVQEMVYGFDRYGNIVTSWQAPFERNTSNAIAWDCDREVLWLATSTESEILAYDVDGGHQQTIELPDIRFTGFAYVSEDPDNHPLYIVSSEQDSLMVVYKMNPDTEDTMEVVKLDLGHGNKPQSAFATNMYDFNNWLLLTVRSSNGGVDFLDIWQITANKDWFKLFQNVEDQQVSISSGIIEAGETQNLSATLNTVGLPKAFPFHGMFTIVHNANGGEAVVDCYLEAIGERPSNAFALIAPDDGDTLNPVVDEEVEFVWQESWDPNSNQESTYAIWFESNDQIATKITDSSERSWRTTLTSLAEALNIDLVVERDVFWGVKAISAGDTVDCEHPFSFRLRANSIDDDVEQPVQFGLNSIYPSPFNSTTRINFGIDHPGNVQLEIFDIMGRSVAKLIDGYFNTDYHEITWRSDRVPAGVYIVSLQHNGRTSISKVICLK
ncbi:C25 family cysteine peptidase [Calditrichota bacterium]